MMYNYPLIDIHGKTLGVISLETEELPTLLMDGRRVELSVSFRSSDKKILALMAVPNLGVPRG